MVKNRTFSNFQINIWDLIITVYPEWCGAAWRGVAWRGVELTLEGYNWEVGRGAISWWWGDWGPDRGDGPCAFPLVLLSCPRKMAIPRVELGLKRK